MTTILTGVGMWLWVIDSCEGGDVERIADKAAEMELAWVAPKATQGTMLYHKNKTKLVPLAKALHARGIRVIPWGWVHGRSPYAPYSSIARTEALVAFEAIHMMEADGWIIDAEHEWKRTWLNMHLEASKYMKPLEDLSIPIFVSTYRYPKSHREFPFRAWQNTFQVERGDGWVPQVYWEQDFRLLAGRYQLQASYDQHKDLGYLAQGEAFYPSPPVYGAGEWRATAEQVLYFTKKVEELELTTYIPWSWQHMRPEHWAALQSRWYRPPFDLIIPDPEPEPDPLPEEAIKHVRVTAGGLNVRWGPNSANSIATSALVQGAEVYVYEIIGYWGRIESDKCHWIHLGYTKEI